MRSRTMPMKPVEPTPPTSGSMIHKGDPMRRENMPNNSLAKDRKLNATEKYSRKLILAMIALAITLSLGSIRWITEKKVVPAPPVAVQPVLAPPPAPVKDTTAKVQEAMPVVEVEKEPVRAVVATTDPARKFRKNWTKYITATNSNYAYGVLGGINDLSVVFTNKTDYVLDEMTAEVTYIKNNGKPWKTRFVTMYQIPPRSERKQVLEKVNRGKSVEVSITKIVSSKMHFFYTPDRKSATAGDPYFMH